MTKADIIFHWVAVSFYAASSCLFLMAFTFKKEKLYHYASYSAAFGLIPHSVALLLRWYESGHGPYLKRYEVISSDVWICLIMFVIALKLLPRIKKTGIVVLPASFLLIGMGIMSSREISPLPETYHTFWLVIHILFAKLAYGSALIGTALAVLTWLTNKKQNNMETHDHQDISKFDQLSYRFLGFSFFNIAIMIAAGAIWAENAWGVYWSWDPIEVWSLVSWIIYGIYLHLRKIHGWRGTKASIFAVFAFLILLFAVLGIGLVYDTQHSPYFN